MKKTYKTPQTEVIILKAQNSLLQASSIDVSSSNWNSSGTIQASEFQDSGSSSEDW